MIVAWVFLLLGYLLVGVFIAVERSLRKTEGAKTFQRGSFDRGSTFLIGAAFGAGLLLPLILDLLGVGLVAINPLWDTLAVLLMVAGIGLRVWAATSLGRFYTRTLLTTDDQKVVSTGPYAWVRHPGYLGDLLLWSGFGVLSGNVVILLLFPVMFTAVYLYRIKVEERMLVQTLGVEYSQYRKRTRKLIPFVY